MFTVLFPKELGCPFGELGWTCCCMVVGSADAPHVSGWVYSHTTYSATHTGPTQPSRLAPSTSGAANYSSALFPHFNRVCCKALPQQPEGRSYLCPFFLGTAVWNKMKLIRTHIPEHSRLKAFSGELKCHSGRQLTHRVSSSAHSSHHIPCFSRCLTPSDLPQTLSPPEATLTPSPSPWHQCLWVGPCPWLGQLGGQDVVRGLNL